MQGKHAAHEVSIVDVQELTRYSLDAQTLQALHAVSAVNVHCTLSVWPVLHVEQVEHKDNPDEAAKVPGEQELHPVPAVDDTKVPDEHNWHTVDPEDEE